MKEEMIEIIKSAQKGNEEAFNQLFQYYYGKAYGIAWQITKNDADAKDVVQEAFLSIHASLNDLREPEYFQSWMRMIVISKCHKLFRKRKDIPSDPEIMNSGMNKEVRKYMNPEEYYTYVNEQEVLYTLIQRLKPKYQDVINLVYLKQMKIDEAAAMLGISSGTVKTRIHRAKKDLLHEVKQFEQENHRKLDFHADTFFATASITTFFSFSTFQQSIAKLKQLVTTNALTSTCVVSLSVLTVTGGVFAYQDIKQAASLEKQDQATQEAAHNEESQEESNQAIVFNSFPHTSYEDQEITDSKSAYYTCINFAMNEEEMKQRSKEEFIKIEPVYNALKQRQDGYWDKLSSEGWSSLYEKYH